MNYQNFAKPNGLLIFNDLADALRNGFELFDTRTDGYLVRTRTNNGWALALVQQRTNGNSSR